MTTRPRVVVATGFSTVESENHGWSRSRHFRRNCETTSTMNGDHTEQSAQVCQVVQEIDHGAIHPPFGSVPGA